jgi:diaminohydroxyphosphoribosylaminopyrimidine deaminase/5-amino-6-(5-phosphoribosylamino)uracil reductase
VVLDARLRLPAGSQLVATAAQSPVIAATTRAGLQAAGDHAEALRTRRVELLELPPGSGGVDAGALLDELGRRQWTYLLVEGGAAVLDTFLRAGLADEVLVFVSSQRIGPDDPGLPHLDIALIREELGLCLESERPFGQDRLLRLVPAR